MSLAPGPAHFSPVGCSRAPGNVLLAHAQPPRPGCSHVPTGRGGGGASRAVGGGVWRAVRRRAAGTNGGAEAGGKSSVRRSREGKDPGRRRSPEVRRPGADGPAGGGARAAETLRWAGGGGEGSARAAGRAIKSGGSARPPPRGGAGPVWPPSVARGVRRPTGRCGGGWEGGRRVRPSSRPPFRQSVCLAGPPFRLGVCRAPVGFLPEGTGRPHRHSRSPAVLFSSLFSLSLDSRCSPPALARGLPLRRPGSRKCCAVAVPAGSPQP